MPAHLVEEAAVGDRCGDEALCLGLDDEGLDMRVEERLTAHKGDAACTRLAQHRWDLHAA